MVVENAKLKNVAVSFVFFGWVGWVIPGLELRKSFIVNVKGRVLGSDREEGVLEKAKLAFDIYCRVIMELTQKRFDIVVFCAVYFRDENSSFSTVGGSAGRC